LYLFNKNIRNRLALLITFVGLFLIVQGLYIPLKAEFAQYLLERAWQHSQQQHTINKPWPWADTYPIAKLSFIEQQKSQIILAGSSGRTMAFAPGHLDGTAEPGELGHVIISAHRDTHFSKLKYLHQGDTIKLEGRNGLVRTYKISTINVIDSRYEALILEPTSNKLTLITCYPFDAIQAGGPLRYRIDATLEI